MEPVPDDLAAGLPQQRDDEPASLRQDIVDELRDHLVSAAHRERFRGAGDDQTAWQRVLARFGDPRAIARKLYWQAMWSRVMQQRIVLAGGAGMLALGVVMVVMMWMMLERQQEMVQRQLASAERHQANLEAMLARLGTPTSNFGSLKVQVDRPAWVTLQGGSLKEQVSYAPLEFADPKGSQEYDFGELPPGIYSVMIGVENWTHIRKFVLRSGETHCEVVMIPPAESAEVTFTTNLSGPYPSSIKFDVVEFIMVTFQQREWKRHVQVPRFELSPRNAKTIFPAMVGRGQVLLRLIRNPRGVYSITGYLRDWEDGAKPTDDDERILEIDLKPGPNSCHIEIPEEWIAKANHEAAQTAARLQPVIDEMIRKVMKTEMQAILESGKDGRIESKKRIALSIMLDGNNENGIEDLKFLIWQLIKTRIDESEVFQLINSDFADPSTRQRKQSDYALKAMIVVTSNRNTSLWLGFEHPTNGIPVGDEVTEDLADIE